MELKVNPKFTKEISKYELDEALKGIRQDYVNVEEIDDEKWLKDIPDAMNRLALELKILK